MLIIAIPARAGSQRIKNKNIVKLDGKPLICHILDKLEKSNINYKIYVTTDCKKILKILQNYKKIKTVVRPKSISGNNSKIEDALIHLIQNYKNTDHKWILTIQPNSPFLSIETIKIIINSLKKNSCKSIMTVTENRGDFWIKNSQNYLKRLFPKAPRQQQLRKPLFEENSAVYATNINYLLKNKKIFCNNMSFVPISKTEGFDINNKEDLKIAKAIVAMNKNYF